MEKLRKEVLLDEQTVLALSEQAKREGRNLKNYMEQVLRMKAKEAELTDEYKKMMDKMLADDADGTLMYTAWDEVKIALNH